MQKLIKVSVAVDPTPSQRLYIRRSSSRQPLAGVAVKAAIHQELHIQPVYHAVVVRVTAGRMLTKRPGIEVVEPLSWRFGARLVWEQAKWEVSDNMYWMCKPA